MSTIKADYAAMTAGQEGLVATWARIETHLADLDATVAATQDMQADSLTAYHALKLRWSASAADRQLVLQQLASLVGAARDHYRQVDTMLANRFAV
ncbi:hypothetical protein GIS00_19050 [Nakamurella sp. YIM 132087]|uniref:WXG100 family type VII secretion target n=1 Tax=Nakamurella alba TaxID=2665158 RepID=A0A7K1FPG2_9ACTN|nr:hypothetical protein [Nakamurella alba]MTD16038.1 hypothetical protein [Nakamurella alba]